MKIEILTIGDEILSGNITDTNKAWLSDQLWRAGFHVAYHSGVRDDPPAIRDSLLLARERSDAVIVTGGLGPTADDFTIEIAAQTFNRPLVLDQPSLDHIYDLFNKMGRPVKDNNKKQAMIPTGAKALFNKEGTAPGVYLEETFLNKFSDRFSNKKIPFYFLPGVPREMKHLFSTFVLPDLLTRQSEPVHLETRFYKCFGVGESDLDFALKDLFDERTTIEGIRVGYRAHVTETSIKLSSWNKDPQLAKKKLLTVEEKILSRIGAYVYGGEHDTLESVVGKLLAKKNKTVATAESCTGGLIANRFTNISGASGYFKCGYVTYANESKINMLGVSAQTLESHGAVSEECVKEMALGARVRSQVDYALAVSGIAGPTGGTPDKPVGTVFIGLATPTHCEVKKFHIPRGRDLFKIMVSSLALDWLRKVLMEPSY